MFKWNFVIICTVLFFVCHASAQVQAIIPSRTKEKEKERTRNLGERIGQYLERKDYDGAAKSLDETLSIDPTNTQAKSLKAAVLIYQKKFDDAETIYGELIKAEPENMSLIWNRAEIHFLKGEYSQARELLETLRKRSPLDEMLTYKVGLTFLMEGKLAEAKAEIEKIRFPSNTAGYYYGRAAIAFKEGNKQEGLKWTAEAARIFNFKHNALFADSLVEKGLMVSGEIGSKGGIDEMAAPMPGPALVPQVSGSGSSLMN
jgi:tetratricopeptide (TPR) repeat protein